MQADVAKYSQLKLRCWNRQGVNVLDGVEAALYERDCRHVGQETVTADEKQLIDERVSRYVAGVLNV